MKPPGRWLRAICGALSVCPLAACHTMAPPPLGLRHQDSTRDPVGAVHLQLEVGFGAGILAVDDGIGWALKLRWQALRDFQAGLEVGRAYNHNHELGGDPTDNPGRHPHRLNWLRLGSRYHALDDVTVEGGVGGGFTDFGMTWLTLDTGATGGTRFTLPGDAGHAGPYGGPLVAVAIPLAQGVPIRRSKYTLGGAPKHEVHTQWKDATYNTTVHVGGTFGGAYRTASDPAFGTSLEAGFLFAVSDNDVSVLLGGSQAIGTTLTTD